MLEHFVLFYTHFDDYVHFIIFFLQMMRKCLISKGFTPSTFVSSRSKDGEKTQAKKPEDFMDEEVMIA